MSQLALLPLHMNTGFYGDGSGYTVIINIVFFSVGRATLDARIDLLESMIFYLYLAISSLFSATSLTFCGNVFKISVYVARTHRHDNKH